MRIELISILSCPKCRLDLEFFGETGSNLLVLKCGRGHKYPVVNDIPRFVEAENYAASFGFQWNKFSRVQLDSYNHSGFSEERFRSITGWGESELRGKRVLDTGCGAGRFAEIAVKYGADLVAIDLSNAVENCRANLSAYDPFVCQASIYQLPFKPGSFDLVYCIGVIQHTPDPLKSIRSLCEMVKPGGQIGLWIYETTLNAFVGTTGFKYALRPIISRWPRGKQENFCRRLVKVFYPLIRILKNCGLPGKIIMRLLPVSSAHLQSVRLSPSDFKTWVFLDTFDMYTPAYDQPQRFSTVARVLAQQGYENIQRHPHGAVSITATRKS